MTTMYESAEREISSAAAAVTATLAGTAGGVLAHHPTGGCCQDGPHRHGVTADGQGG